MGVPFKSWDSIICCISRMNECWFFACSYMASGKLKVTLGICIWSVIIWSNYLDFFLESPNFLIYPPGFPNWIKISWIFKKKKKKSHHKKIFCIMKYCSILCSLYLFSSFKITNIQNNKRDMCLLSMSPTKIFFIVHL